MHVCHYSSEICEPNLPEYQKKIFTDLLNVSMTRFWGGCGGYVHKKSSTGGGVLYATNGGFGGFYRGGMPKMT